MKNSLILLLILIANILHAQTTNNQLITMTKPALDFALGIGPKFNLAKEFGASISPLDSTLQLQKLPSTSFVISATLVFPLGQRKESKILSTATGQAHIYSYKKFNSINGAGQAQKVAHTDPQDNGEASPKWSILASLNLVDINSNGVSFNKQIDGGIGIGYRLSDAIHLGLFCEFTSYRQLKDFIATNYAGKPIIVNGQKISTLDQNDDNYFFTKQIPSIALKIIIPIGNYNVQLE